MGAHLFFGTSYIHVGSWWKQRDTRLSQLQVCLHMPGCASALLLGSVVKLKVVSGGVEKKKYIHLKGFYIPLVVHCANVHLDLPRSQLFVPRGACYHGNDTIVTFP